MMRRSPLKPGAGFKSNSLARGERIEAREVTKTITKAAREKKHKCAVRTCRAEFVRPRPFETWCSPECGTALAMAKIEKQLAVKVKAERAAHKVALVKFKPRKWFLAKAKTAMHLYVRTRDEGKPCCSCDTVLIRLGRLGGDYDAGHLRSVGSAKHLEFDPRNVWGQCKHCNDRLHGNEREYERRLRLREGDAMVDALMADNDERHLKNADFEAIEAHYKKLLKELKAAADTAPA